MKKLLLFVLFSVVSIACSKTEIPDVNTPSSDRVTRAEGDVFKVQCLTEEIQSFPPFEQMAIDPQGNICQSYKSYINFYLAGSNSWPYLDERSLVPTITRIAGITSDTGGNWIFYESGRLLKYAPDLLSYVDYSQAIPQGSYIISACTNGANIVVALGMNCTDIYNPTFDKISIYSISSRRVLTHIVDIPVYVKAGPDFGHPVQAKLLKAKGDYVYFNNHDALCFRINLTTKAVDSFTPRFTPSAIFTGSNCDYLYGLDDHWIVQMRFDQPSDYEVGEIPAFCKWSDGTTHTIELASFQRSQQINTNIDGSEFYISGIETSNWRSSFYKLYGVK